MPVAGWHKLPIRELFSSSSPGDWGDEGTPDTGTAVLRSTNFRDDGSIDYGDIAYRSIATARLEKRRIRRGTILIEKAGGSSTRPAGRVVFCDRDFNGTASNFVEIVKVAGSQVPQYTFYLLYWNFHTGRVYKYQQQTTGIINFKLNEYGEEMVLVPQSPVEQSKIAEVLSTVDRAIEQTEAVMAKQQRIKTGLMQDLLTRGIDEHGNLRSEQTHKFVDSAIGRVPVDWTVCSLGAALKKVKGFLQTGPFGSQLHAEEYVHEGVPVIMPQDISFEGISTSSIARIPETRANDLRRHRVQPNDIVFSRRGDLSRAAAIGSREEGWICGTGCFLLRVPSVAIDSRWFVDVYRHQRVQRQVETNAVGSTMPSLNNAVMEQLTLAFPAIDEQREITRRRDAMDSVLLALASQLDKLNALKRGLMKDLLSGDRRVTALLESREAVTV